MLFGEGSDGQKWGMLIGSVIGGGAGMKGGARFDAWRAGKSMPRVSAEPITAPASPRMSLSEAVGKQRAEKWITRGRELADNRDPALSALLSDEQVGALYGYTTDPGYQMVNPALRGMKPMTKEMEAFTQHINDGLDQLPAFSGETYRGMNSLPSHILDGYTPGKTVIDPAFVSTDVNQGFSGPIQMRIEGFSGRKIDFLSEFNATETEVLFKPNTSFEVISRSDELGITNIELREIP